MRASTSSTVRPSTNFGIACKLPWQPPVNTTLCTTLPSNSNSIRVEQVPCVLYVYFILSSFLCENLYCNIVYKGKGKFARCFKLYC